LHIFGIKITFAQFYVCRYASLHKSNLDPKPALKYTGFQNTLRPYFKSNGFNNFHTCVVFPFSSIGTCA
jgi:hypothetical protein